MTRKKKKPLIALDLGTTTGWAVFVAGELVAHGRWRLGSERLDRGHVLHGHICQLAIELHQRYGQPPTLAFERIMRPGKFDGADAWTLYGHLEFCMRLACREAGIKPTPVYPGTWKKGTVGSGRASKDATRQWVNRTFGLELRRCNQDEADAICIGYTISQVHRSAVGGEHPDVHGGPSPRARRSGKRTRRANQKARAS